MQGNYKKQREKVVQVIQNNDNDHKLFLEQFTSDYELISFMVDSRNKKKILKENIFNMDYEISDSAFGNLLQDVFNQFKELVEKEEEDKNANEVLSQLIKQQIEKSSIDKQINPPKKQEGKKSIPPKKQIEKEHFEKIVKKQKSKIKGDQISVKVRILDIVLELDYTIKQKYNLKQQIACYILNYLKHASISVKRVAKSLPILSNIDFIKSEDAGHYQYDAFHGTIDIMLVARQGQFKNDFLIEGQPELQFEIVKELKDWKQSCENLLPCENVQHLLKYCCQKRQANEEVFNQLKRLFVSTGGVNRISQLFQWQKADYQRIKVKNAFVFEILDIIKRIKYSSKQQSLRNLDKEKQNCIKIGNAHKILRFLVFKNHGTSELIKLPLLNKQNVKKAIEIVKKQIFNEQLLETLENGFFNQYFLMPGEQKIEVQRGLILFGPPGTGKTVLTEALPELMGFHLIEKGLSAASFMKSLVGQSSRMIEDLVLRAKISPYLLCSIAIDEIDGLVPDRKDKDEKNKGEGISMLLSVIGGNKDVPNLIFLSSTNYLKKIDQAIRRRLSGQYMVGRPDPSARKQIIKNKIPYFCEPLTQKELDYAVQITSNFTGAAIKRLCYKLLTKLNIQRQNDQKLCLKQSDIVSQSIVVAQQFSIRLGLRTLPQIFQAQTKSKHQLTEEYMSKIQRPFMLVKNVKDGQYQLTYVNCIRKYIQGKVKPILEQQHGIFDLDDVKKGEEKEKGEEKGDGFEKLIKYFSKNFRSSQVVVINYSDFKSFVGYSQAVRKEVNRKVLQNQKARVLVIKDWEMQGGLGSGDIILELRLFQRNLYNTFLFFYFNTHIQTQSLIDSCIPQWSQKNQDHIHYSGRIMVRLDNEAEMSFQLNSHFKEDSKVALKHFMRVKDSRSINDIIPQLIEFFRKQQASCILMLDQELLLQNDAFETKKEKQILEQKMAEAKGYKRAAVIIYMDSLLQISKNASNSSMGPTQSFSIGNQDMLQNLINYIKYFPKVSEDESKWVCIICQHQFLIETVKERVKWPKQPKEEQEQQKEQELDKKKKCLRCHAIYTERENKKQRKCMQHPKPLYNLETMSYCQQSKWELMIEIHKRKKTNNSYGERFIYPCCMRGINEAGEKGYEHIEKMEEQDDHEQDINDARIEGI